MNTEPNEALLNHFERHDLRYAIANMGGRERMAEKLGGARLIPGQWHVAIRQSKEVQCLLRKDNPSGAGLNMQSCAAHRTACEKDFGPRRSAEGQDRKEKSS